jgi:hypothetical protein
MPPVEIRDDVGKLADLIRAAKAGTIAIDRCDGAGKTALANQLGNLLDRSNIDFDTFLNKHLGSYVAALKLDELETAIRTTSASDQGLIISGVCMLDVLGRVGASADLIVYVERRSKRDILGDFYILRCEEGFSIPENLPLSDLQKELCDYHCAFKPRSRADLIFVRQEA